jgi:hypothetical protein
MASKSIPRVLPIFLVAVGLFLALARLGSPTPIRATNDTSGAIVEILADDWVFVGEPPSVTVRIQTSEPVFKKYTHRPVQVDLATSTGQMLSRRDPLQAGADPRQRLRGDSHRKVPGVPSQSQRPSDQCGELHAAHPGAAIQGSKRSV